MQYMTITQFNPRNCCKLIVRRRNMNNKVVFNSYFILNNRAGNTKILIYFVNIYDGTIFIINTIHYRCRARIPLQRIVTRST